MKTLLDYLSRSERTTLDNDSQLISLKQGETLFNRGGHAERFFLVLSGQVKLIRTMATGEEKVFKSFTTGGVIAEAAMFMTSYKYPMTAIAETESQLQAFSRQTLHALISASPLLAQQLLAMMSERIAQLMDSIDTLTQISAEQRLVMFLGQLYKQQQSTDRVITLPFAKKVLANQLSIKPETLSRLFKKLKQNALIAEKQHQVEVLDIDKLCQFVNVTPDVFKV